MEFLLDGIMAVLGPGGWKMIDQVGYYAVECWGGATFDSCLRFLKEDPWERLRKLRAGFKNTKLQMLFRGQNILGYNHYADDVVEYFVQKSIANGIDIIRIFDCLNDIRNLRTAVKATNKEKGHAQIDQTEVSRGEVLRYMGCKGAQSEAVMALVEDCLAQLGQACEPRHLTAVFPLSLSADGGIDLSHALFFQWDREILSGLEPEERQNLLSLLERLTEDRRGTCGEGASGHGL